MIVSQRVKVDNIHNGFRYSYWTLQSTEYINEEPQYISILNYIWLKLPNCEKYSLGEASPWKGWSSAAEQAQAGSLQEKVVTSILFSWETENFTQKLKWIHTYAELASEVKSNSKFSSICTQTCQNLEWGYLTNFEQNLFVQIHIEWQYLLRSFHEKYGGHHYFLSWRESWTKFEDWDWFNARNYCRWVIGDYLVLPSLWQLNTATTFGGIQI